MRLFAPAQPISGSSMLIPFAMRAALGWHAGMTLSCWSHPGNSPGSSVHHNQLSISVYPPNTRELWHLAARFRDKAGMLSQLASLLTDQQIDIITCRAATHLQNSEFSVDMEIDTASYHSDLDLAREERKRLPARGLPELEARIVCKFIKEVVFLPDGTPSVRLTRNPILTGTIYPDEFRYNITLKRHGTVALPSRALKHVRDSFLITHPELEKKFRRKPVPLVLLSADARWRVVDALFYYRNTGYIHARINARDQVGGLDAITSELKNHGFNILQLYSRVLPNRGRGILDLLVYLPGDKAASDERLAAYVAGSLRGKNLKELGLKVTFPPAEEPRRK